MAGPRAKITIKGQEPGTFEIHDQSVLGRSEACDIQIHDRYVSRRQLVISCSEAECQAENIGRNPILIDGVPLESGSKARLPDRCTIQAGRTIMEFQALVPEQQQAPVPPPPPEGGAQEPEGSEEVLEEQTVLITTPLAETGPRLVITAPSGQSTTYGLEQLPVVIGRAPDCTIRLDDPAVSRHHCQIELSGERFKVKNLSSTNPVTLNGKEITEALLHTGDQIGIGPYVASFLSDRPQDKPAEAAASRFPIDPKIAAVAGAFILVLAAAWLFFSVVFPSWQFRSRLSQAEKYQEQGQYQKAEVALEELLAKGLDPDQETAVKGIMVRTVLAHASRLADAGKISEAKRLLIRFLRQHGSGQEAKPVWDQLDYYRIAQGKLLEAEGKFTEALGEYASVPEDSPYFENARSELSRLWLEYQKRYLRSQTVSQLLAEAEEHLKAGRILAPVNKNAYAAYQAILSLDPENETALQKIEEIKTMFRDRGMKAYKAGRWADALANFEKYLLIEPQDKEIKRYLAKCRKRLGSRKKRRTSRGSASQKQKVQKLLRESGTNSTWIMKYLFEEQKGGNKETPW